MQAQTPRWFTAVTRSKCSIGSSAASDGGTWMPALLNAMSSRPYSATARSTITDTWASSATSQAMPIALPPSVSDDTLGLPCGERAVQVGQHDRGAALGEHPRRRQLHAFGGASD